MDQFITTAESETHLKELPDGYQRSVRCYALIIIAITTLVYSNTFQAPFIFDDKVNIVENTSIRGVPSMLHAFQPASGTSVTGRPLINFTLAVNYAISGLAPWSYHLFNLVIHIISALILFDIIRRTFLCSRFPEPFRKLSLPLSFVSALIWATHPLQTQAVTYITQRCESLMGLCFLLVFYFAIRGWQSKKQSAWHLASIVAMFAGVGSKEVIVVAPVLLFYYDILFVNKSPRQAARHSPLLYAGLVAGIGALAVLVLSGGTLSSIPSDKVYSACEFWRTQPNVILHYIHLSFWPSPLSISYGLEAASWSEAWLACLLLAILLTVSVGATIGRHPASFPAAWFFLILATTIIVPLLDFAYEYRMYLPLASIVLLTVTTVVWIDNVISTRLQATRSKFFHSTRNWKWYLLFLISASFCILTYSRNIDYQDKISIWKDAAQKYPYNSGAILNLANAFMEKGQNKSALAALNNAMRIEKQRAKMYAASAPGNVNREVLYRKYLALRPVYTGVENNLGLLWLGQGDADTALRHFQSALQVNANDPGTHSNAGMAFVMLDRIPEARKAFERAIALDPDFVNAYVNLGALQLRIHQKPDEAIRYFTEAIRLLPDHVDANFGMAVALHQINKDSEAVVFLKKTIRLAPDFKPAQKVLDSIQSATKQIREPA